MKTTLRPSILAASISLFFLAPNIVQAQSSPPDRGGFTFRAGVGFGGQLDEERIDEWKAGFGGLDVGLGWFVHPDLAVMVRTSGTHVRWKTTSADVIYDNYQFSAVVVLEGQWWPSDRVNLEAGAGFGVIENDYSKDDNGLGLLAALGYSLYAKGAHSVRLSLEYAPVFGDDRNVHNVSLSLGLQML